MNNEDEKQENPTRKLAGILLEAAEKFADVAVKKYLGVDDPTKPHLIEKDGIGYLTIKNKVIKIGAVGIRKYKLLKCLITPFGVPKTMDAVFDQIRLSKDRRNEALLNSITSKAAREEIVKNTVKEVQRILSNNGFKKILKFSFGNETMKVEWR